MRQYASASSSEPMSSRGESAHESPSPMVSRGRPPGVIASPPEALSSETAFSAVLAGRKFAGQSPPSNSQPMGPNRLTSTV